MLDWWIEASGYYAGYETTIFVCSKDGKLCVEPEKHEAEIKRLVERGESAPGLPKPPKGSFSQLYDVATKITYEGEFEPVKSKPGEIY